MSTYYKIGEIAALYGISTDILRYYEELGILVPRRAPNGYRIYRTEDLWCLNVIRDLRDLGFSMDQIRSYIENRSVGSTLELFQQEMCLIDQQIARLQGLRDNIITRRETIAQAVRLPLGTGAASSMRRCSSSTRRENIPSRRDPICPSATAAASGRPAGSCPSSCNMPGTTVWRPAAPCWSCSGSTTTPPNMWRSR